MAWTTTLFLALGIAIYGVTDAAYLTKLADYVKSNSDPDVVPMFNATTPLPVSFNFSIMNVADVDKEHNKVTLDIYYRPRWTINITWDPADYDGIERVTLPAKYFWIPTMMPYGNAIQVKDLSLRKVIFYHNGTAFYNHLYKMDIWCDVTNIATGASCNVFSNLWGYNNEETYLEEIGPDTTGTMGYFAGSKYEITDCKMNVFDTIFDRKPYGIFNFTVTIKEKPRVRSGPVNLHFEWH